MPKASSSSRRKHGARRTTAIAIAIAIGSASCQLLVPGADDLTGGQPAQSASTRDASGGSPLPNDGSARVDGGRPGELPTLGDGSAPDASPDASGTTVRLWDLSTGCASFTMIGAGQISTVTDQVSSPPAACRFCADGARAELVLPIPPDLLSGPRATLALFARAEGGDPIAFTLAIAWTELRRTTNATANATFSRASVTATDVFDEQATFRVALEGGVGSSGCIVIDDVSLTQ